MRLRFLPNLAALVAAFFLAAPVFGQAIPAPPPVLHFDDNNGNPLSGGKLFTYLAGTTTKVSTFTSSNAATPNTNPIILNSRGEASVWLGNARYKFVLSPSTDSDPPSNPIFTADNIAGFPITNCVSAGGLVGDGVTLNDAAMTSFLATNPPCMQIGSGVYKFANAVSYTVPSTLFQPFSIICAGPEATVFQWPNAGGGMTLTLSSLSNAVNINGCTFTTGQAGGNTGLTITTNIAQVTVPNWNKSTLYNLSFHGSDGLQIADYWGTNLLTRNVGLISCDSCTAYGAITGLSGGYVGNGIGWDIEGDANHLATVFNAYNFNGQYLSSCWNYGNNVQGVTVQFSNCTGGTFGLNMSGGSGQFQLNMSDNQINVSNTGINLTSQLVAPNIHDNLILIPSASAIGINLTPAAFAQVHHNNIEAIGTVQGTGIVIGSTANGTNLIDSNIIESGGIGVDIKSGSMLLTLRNNAYYGNNTNILNRNSTFFRGITIDSPLDCSATALLQLGGTSSGISQITPYCRYTNDGNNMTVSLLVALNSISGHSPGNATIPLPLQGGLSQGVGACNMVKVNGFTGLGTPMSYVDAGATSITLSQLSGGSGSVPITDTNFTNSTNFTLFCSIPILP